MASLGPAGFVRVAARHEIPRGESRVVEVGERVVALFDVAGDLFAVDNACPHQGAPLADGWVDDHRVTCPWHGWCFDLRTGHLEIGAEYEAISTYQVRVEGDDVYVATTPAASLGR